jgi:hypothetical protein
VNYAVDIAAEGMIYILCFVTVGSGIRVLLRGYLNNLRGCSVGAAGKRDLLSMSLR